ncbi:MAG TPA: DUF4393 domain-containing protein [Gammaproteobacteria bacterium]|nr:DUF4393 domain-containing protein [Gammaproteobacteria bacterium]
MNEEPSKILTEILDSKTAEKVYDDGLSDAVSETGGALTDVVKTARLFTAPFQIAAAYQDRLRVWIGKVIRKVPEERRVQAPARIAGPVFEELRYLDDGDVIAEMYLSLLSKAIDKERHDDAHPAFVKIIGHLSPDEALILHHLGNKAYEERYESLYDLSKNIFHSKKIIYQEFPVDELVYPNNFYVYTSHLISLDLVAFPVYRQEPTWEDEKRQVQKGEIGHAILHLTEFGQMFVRACEPKER